MPQDRGQRDMLDHIGEVSSVIGVAVVHDADRSGRWGIGGRPHIVGHSDARVLVEDPSIAEYYLPSGRQWGRWSSTRNIVLASGASTGGPSSSAGLSGPGNAGTFGEKIAAHYFAIVALNFADTTSLDKHITTDLRRNGHYCVIQVVPYGIEIPPIGVGDYVIWRYNPHVLFPRPKPQLWNCA